MNNIVGVSIIVTNLAVVGLFAYSAWSIHKFSRRIEKKIDDAAAAAKERTARIIKDLL